MTQFPVNAAGKKIYPTEFKKKMLEELKAGATAAELSRKHGVSMQNILYWKQAAEKAVTGKTKEPTSEQTVPATEYKRILEENKVLRKALANAALDRDILKEAVDIATKKKWI
jgi:transposase-like protein